MNRRERTPPSVHDDHADPDARHRARPAAPDLRDISGSDIEQRDLVGRAGHLLGVSQKTVWNMGHAIRELIDDRNGQLPPIDDIAAVDGSDLGGAPKSLSAA